MKDPGQIRFDHRYDSLRAVYRLRRYSDAADELSLTPSAVSHQIRAIEKELGAALFIKKKNMLVPTPECEIVLRNIGRVDAIVSRMESDMDGCRSLQKIVGIGVTPSLQSRLTGVLLPRLAPPEDPQTVKFVVSSGTSDELCDRLADEVIDLAVIEGGFDSSKFDSLLIDTDYLTVAVPSSSRYAARGLITVSELVSEKLILKPENSGTRRLFESCLESGGVSPSRLNIIMEAESVDTIIRLVSAGYGISVLSERSCSGYAERGIISTVPLESESMTRGIHAVYNRGSSAGEIAMALRMAAGNSVSERENSDK
ncbi:MAG: LysR family transcriptional regulator [Clostridia bacterium]|nr:LysR family transcriptional regulator [Clostridia bacterium]